MEQLTCKASQFRSQKFFLLLFLEKLAYLNLFITWNHNGIKRFCFWLASEFSQIGQIMMTTYFLHCLPFLTWKCLSVSYAWNSERPGLAYILGFWGLPDQTIYSSGTPRVQLWLSGHMMLSKYLGTSGEAILWQPRELPLMCESHFPQTNSPEATMEGRGKCVLKITHKCNCWVGGTDFRAPTLVVRTDFPPGLRRASTLNSDEFGTLICLFWTSLLGSSWHTIKTTLTCAERVEKASRRRRETQIHQFASIRTETE